MKKCLNYKKICDMIRNMNLEAKVEMFNAIQEDRGAIVEESIYDLDNKVDKIAFGMVYDSYITNNRASNGRYWIGGVNFPADKTFEINESNINELVADALTNYIEEE